MAAVLAANGLFAQCACCAGAGVGSSNGDYNNGILTLPKHTVIAEAYGDYRTIHNGDAPEEDEKLLKSLFVSSLGLRYGISGRVTVSVLLPYVFLHTNSGDDNGLGDLILLGTFSIYAQDKLSFALIGGIELPTGVQKDSNFDNTTVIVGSGSYDPMMGVAISKTWGRISLQGNGLFKVSTNGFKGNYYGDLSTHNLSLSYRLAGEKSFCAADTSVKDPASGFGLNIFGGYYGEWLDKVKEDDEIDDDSGHYLGFAVLGLNTSYKKWAFPVTLSLPVITAENGEQNEAGYRLRLGIVKSF